MFQYPGQIMRIVDGDTLWLELDLGFRIKLKVDVRLAHINTPETINFTAQGLADPAAEFVNRACPVGSIVVADIIKQEKNGRWLAAIYYRAGENDRDKIMQAPLVLNNELVQAGLAKPYEGGKK